MKQLYFLLQDLATARSVVDDLLIAGIGWKDIHLVARDDIELVNLPEAALLQKSDLLPALRQSAGVGAATGALAGLVAIALPPVGLTLPAGALLLCLAAAGAGFGAWVGGMIGISVPNRRLSRFREAIAHGQLLLMVDVPGEKFEEVDALVRRHGPEIHIESGEPAIPVFP